MCTAPGSRVAEKAAEAAALLLLLVKDLHYELKEALKALTYGSRLPRLGHGHGGVLTQPRSLLTKLFLDRMAGVAPPSARGAGPRALGHVNVPRIAATAAAVSTSRHVTRTRTRRSWTLPQASAFPFLHHTHARQSQTKSAARAAAVPRHKATLRRPPTGQHRRCGRGAHAAARAALADCASAAAPAAPLLAAWHCSDCTPVAGGRRLSDSASEATRRLGELCSAALYPASLAGRLALDGRGRLAAGSQQRAHEARGAGQLQEAAAARRGAARRQGRLAGKWCVHCVASWGLGLRGRGCGG